MFDASIPNSVRELPYNLRYKFATIISSKKTNIKIINYFNQKIAINTFLQDFKEFAPVRFGIKEEYLERYPGDNYVDIMGLDDYWDFKATSSTPYGIDQIRIVVQLADKYGKVPALTETGLTGLTNENWFTTVLLDPIKADPIASCIAYFLVWRNYSIKHHYAPYPGEKAVPDFLKFYNDPITIFEKDLPNMYVMPQNILAFYI